MSEISKKVAYIKGMAEGMELTADTAKDAKDKLLLQMLDALDLIAEELDSIRDRQDEAERYIDELDSDLGELEEAVFEEDDEDEDEGCCGSCCCDEDDEDDGEEPVFYEVTCPACENTITIDEDVLNLGSIECPNCGETLEFEGIEEDEDEPDDDGEDKD